MKRLDLIKAILELHNFFCVQSTKMGLWDMSGKTFDMSLLETKADRFYLVEKPTTANDDDNNKTFSPMVEVRYHLRSKEARAYGTGHSYFYQRYIDSIAFTYDDIENPEKYKANLIAEFLKQKDKRTV